MELGAFSVGLAVEDLAASMEFYGKLGFTQYAGDPAQNWVIMKNGHANIGLFQGMLEKNVLIFNPGWNQDAEALGSFTDVRELQRQLKAQAPGSTPRRTRQQRAPQARSWQIRTATPSTWTSTCRCRVCTQQSPGQPRRPYAYRELLLFTMRDLLRTVYS
ncbi:hypothetical protein [Arthrobacter sp. SD76]|uniref:hypothetical protein n=1 Tax=Arthrobacter sp. SD76 TaxID=3415007 RepID=UPI003C74D186